MIAPTKKINPYLQFCVSRACTLRCSSCTQLLSLRGHTELNGRDKAYDPVHMSLEVFEEALSLSNDWPKKISIFGGNPPCHPQFKEMMEIFVKYVPNPRRRAIFSNDPLKHADLIREVFAPDGHGDINFNVHYDSDAADRIRKAGMEKFIVGESYSKASYHTPILAAWQDMPERYPTYESWVADREKCQFNAEWSAGVFERSGRPVAYFCEIAGAMDAMLGGNLGMPLVRGWWAKSIEEFDHQVKGCCDKGCGVPMKMLGSKDADEAIDYTEKWKPYVDVTISKRKMNEARLIGGTAALPTESVTDYLGLRTEKPNT